MHTTYPGAPVYKDHDEVLPNPQSHPTHSLCTRNTCTLYHCPCDIYLLFCVCVCVRQQKKQAIFTLPPPPAGNFTREVINVTHDSWQRPVESVCCCRTMYGTPPPTHNWWQRPVKSVYCWRPMYGTPPPRNANTSTYHIKSFSTGKVPSQVRLTAVEGASAFFLPHEILCFFSGSTATPRAAIHIYHYLLLPGYDIYILPFPCHQTTTRHTR